MKMISDAGAIQTTFAIHNSPRILEAGALISAADIEAMADCRIATFYAGNTNGTSSPSKMHPIR